MNPALLSSKRLDWETPPELFQELSRRYGPFDIDLAAAEHNALCERYFTFQDSALRRDWLLTLPDGTTRPSVCFCNPPYGKGLGRWVAKAKREADAGRATTVMLIPARTDTSYWHEHIFFHENVEVEFLPGRVKFRLDGKELDPAPFPSAVVVFQAK